MTEPDQTIEPFDRARFAIRCRASMPSTKQTIVDAVKTILGVARRCGCSQDSEVDLEIALREALANAVLHGNGGDPDKVVFVRCYGDPSGAVLVLVRDNGPGFEPKDIPDPRNSERLQLDHGRGLFLMRELMDRMEYRRAGREVLLFKRW